MNQLINHHIKEIEKLSFSILSYVFSAYEFQKLKSYLSNSSELFSSEYASFLRNIGIISVKAYRLDEEIGSYLDNADKKYGYHIGKYLTSDYVLTSKDACQKIMSAQDFNLKLQNSQKDPLTQLEVTDSRSNPILLINGVEDENEWHIEIELIPFIFLLLHSSR